MVLVDIFISYQPSCTSSNVYLNLWWYSTLIFFSFQAQKRKLGLLEDDEFSKVAKSAFSGEPNSSEAGKNRGMLDSKCFFFLSCILGGR